MDEKDYEVVMAMQKYGGSFVQHLGILAMHADPRNLQLIKDTWTEYWLNYEQMAKADKERSKI